MAKPAIAPTKTAPTATPIPAIAGAVNPPPEGEGDGFTEGGAAGVKGIIRAVDGVVVVPYNEDGILPVANHSERYSRLAVDLCDVASQ